MFYVCYRRPIYPGHECLDIIGPFDTRQESLDFMNQAEPDRYLILEVSIDIAADCVRLPIYFLTLRAHSSTG